MPKVTDLHALEDGRRTAKEHWVLRGLLFAAVGAIGSLQYLTPPTSLHWLYVLQRLYYVAILVAGLDMGWRGGLTAALLSSAAFAVGTPSIWTVSRVNQLDQCLEMCVFCLVGVLTGVLADRQRKQQGALRETTIELSLAHQELQQNFESMKRAERLHALGQLSAGLAHEIRTPLASIEGAAAIVQRVSHSEERCHELLEIIQKESRRLNRLLTSFLDFAKPRRPDLKVVEIDELFDSVIALAQHAGNNRRLELRKEMPPGLSTLECDPEQLKQVLLNVIMNAIQAMPQGGTIVLAVRQNGNTVNIDVHDQGCGISEDNMDRVFDPFFTTKESGSGLGLSVADQIIRQHGGMLTIARSSPEGATVRISLPLKSSHT